MLITSVDDLLREMTLEEKISQLGGPDASRLAAAISNSPDDPVGALAKTLREIAPHGVGHLAMVGGLCSDH
jgi:beta-glucosidase